jgi:AcrR family transcriptional regulator
MDRVAPAVARRGTKGYPGRRARRQAETRARILHAALDLFARQGFFSTTVEQITEAADVGKGTFFNYFPSKEHVLGGFGEVQIARVQAALEEARSGGPATRQIWHGLLRELGREPARSPGLLRSLILVNLSSDEVGSVTRQNLARGRQALARLIADGQQRGDIRSDRKPSQVARLFQQTLLGTMLLWALDPSVPIPSWLDTTFEFFWSSIAAPAEAKAKHRPIKSQRRLQA